MNRHRIEVAIAHLRSIPAEIAERHFNMELWYSDDAAHSVQELINTCGTTACAAGWLCQVPALRQEGLGLGTNLFQPSPSYKDWYGFSALGKFFGINREQAALIFGSRFSRGKAALDAVCAKLEALL